MKYSNKLHAFTVLELIVVMIISSIVIMALFTVMSNTQQLFQMSVSQSYKEVELFDFTQLLIHDMQKANAVYRHGDEIVLELGPKKYVYEFSDEIVVRNRGAVADTFYITVQDIESVRHRDLPLYIETLSFVLPDLLDDERITIAKQYSRGQLFNMKLSLPVQ